MGDRVCVVIRDGGGMVIYVDIGPAVLIPALTAGRAGGEAVWVGGPDGKRRRRRVIAVSAQPAHLTYGRAPS